MRNPASSAGPLRLCLTLSAACLLTLCALAPAASAQDGTGVQPPLALEPMPTQSFEDWRTGFRNQALAQGITAATFDLAFANLQPDPAVIAADRSQPEFARPIWEYLSSALTPARIRNGQGKLARYAAALQRIDQRYAVDIETVVAIWGMESNFGSSMGSRNVIRSLATLAYEGRRPDFAQSELLVALQILQHGDVPARLMIGSWAGAMGQTQFIPSTYAKYAVDFDGDGRRDIWSSPTDALASTANYLQASGWKPGQSWGFEVRLAPGFDYALADLGIRKSIDEWLHLGVRPVAGLLPGSPRNSASLLLPAGHRGPAFLVQDNFRAILRYNNSTAYALAVGLLADSFNGGGRIDGSWPLTDRPLSRSERVELQQNLAAHGYQPGSADGIIGAGTRQALRAFQQSQGLPADGYPTAEILLRLRSPDARP